MTRTCLGTLLTIAMVVAGFSELQTATAQQPAAGAANTVTVAQVDPRALIDGYEFRLDATATGEELERQHDLWVMEVTFKSMRMRYVYLTNKKTGKKEREVIWYLVYKAVVRPIAQRKDTAGVVPKNVEDAVPVSLFVPEFTLVTTDGDTQKIYRDVLIPEAQEDILRNREQRYKRQPRLQNTVESVGDIPAPTLMTAATENAIYGIVMWRGIDPNTDFFKVYMTGFSNGYLKKDNIIRRKTIVQKYKRPGDEFLQSESEISRDGEPSWFYWRDDAQPASKPAPKAKS